MSDKNDSKLPNIPGGEGPKDPRVNAITAILLLAVLGYLVFGMGSNPFAASGADTLATSDFVAAVKDDRVKDVTFKYADGSLTGTYWANGSDKDSSSALKSFKSVYVGADSLAELMADHPGTTYRIDTSSDEVLQTLLFSVLPTVIMLVVFIYFMRRMGSQNGQAMSFGKTKALTAEGERPKVKFSDVAGIDEAVEELQEVRDFLSEPERYRKMGAKIPHGVLLVGPPGTGKTLLAKAVAGEAGVPFFSISGSDFVEMFVGVGASRVRDLFKQAKEAAPCIIFIDEIDAVGRQRGAGLGGGHDEREQTLNQLLVEMDGFEDNSAVILIAATNRPDILDPALLRPGRFDRRVTVDRPDVSGRQKILGVHAANKPLASDVDLERIAKITPGFTGADLANLMNESALLAARRRKEKVGRDEVEEAMERVMAGPERKSRVMSQKEREVIAFHESGHALVGHVLENSDPIHKISIIARGQALGYTMQVPEQDHFLSSRDEMLDQIAVLLGGRTAEELFCGDITTGASNDLERATKIAREMVTRYGMSEELGTQVFGEAQHEVFLGRDYAQKNDYSAETAKRIDDEIERIMREAHDRARKVLSARGDQMRTMAKVLLERETVEGPAVDALLDGTWDQYVAEHPEEGGKPKTAPGQIDEDLVAEAAAAAAERESQ
ncbi:MAG: ATP-dependent zinc metalloprotease FtsH [Paratractidigestivibacter faecalis]|uniref:ATP-dependent zinc metalloprotease FtsH n=1 Tax=Paratractidigestivibacter faecalis TaxID=2292441 RepID=UPI0026EF3971|nr:ATP-dependent zinc metalloprotease FtsH [Paratractidigestivibacter faecalis]MDD6418272.1 ATP-dependent zinc metalloprotease FtsH [Paratractidigestivibacter faecalis]